MLRIGEKREMNDSKMFNLNEDLSELLVRHPIPNLIPIEYIKEKSFCNCKNYNLQVKKIILKLWSMSL